MKLNAGLDNSLRSKKRQMHEEAEVLNKLKEETEFEKNDFLALIFAGFITIMPVVIVILLAYYGISMLFFG